MTLAEPSARQTDRGDGATITLSGDWIAPNAPAMSALAEVPKGTPQRVTIDAAGIGRIDTYGAWSINAMATAAGARGAPADIVGLADEPATVLRQVAEASRQTLPAPPRAGIVDFFETFGRVLFEIGGDSLSMLALFGSIVMSLVGVIARPRTLRWRSVVHQPRPDGRARRAHRRADDVPRRMHHRPAGLLQFPQVRRRPTTWSTW